MATVYLADDLKHERKVALKVLKPELAAVVGAERFLAEIKTTANLQHPHILPLFDSGEDQMMVVTVDATDGFRPGTPRVLFADSYVRDSNAAMYDIAPDGEHFVMVAAGVSGTQGTLILIEDWFTELRERMGEN